MTPKVGDMVLFKQRSRDPVTNGTHIHPAVVTRVWSDTCVNLFVMLDATGGVSRTSVVLGPLDTDAEAWNWRDENVRALEG